MNKAAIITIYSRLNYGNRLQNYAVQEVLKELNIEPFTIKNISKFGMFRKKIDKSFKIGEQITTKNNIYQLKRDLFEIFNNKYLKVFKENINFNDIEEVKKALKGFDYFVVGSDQVWNYNIKSLSELNFLPYIDNENKIAFSASLSIDEIPDKFKDYYKKQLSKFKAISVREKQGKDILEELLERDIPLLIDPILILKRNQWEDIMTKKEIPSNKYLLIYMINTPIDGEIEKLASSSNTDVVDINSIDSKYFLTDPSEFIYLLKNAEYIVTDSYHAAILSIIFNKKCRLYKRKKNYSGMNCRVDTIKDLLNNSLINETDNYLDFIYKDDIYSDSLIKEEQEKAKVFLKKYLK